jgi:hypothetical protein
MATTNLALLREETKNRLASARRTAMQHSLQHTLVRKATGITTAALFGTLARVKVPNTIGGFPWKLGVITLAQLAEGLSKGNIQAAAAGVADSATAIYVAKTIEMDTLIAGGDI